jgi:rhodanese-related sulfurtransferase
VRENFEHAIARIAGCELVPMNYIPARLQHIEGLAEEKLVVVYCHHGVRSLNVVNWLRGQGVPNCVSMTRGIEGWSCEVDAAVPRY